MQRLPMLGQRLAPAKQSQVAALPKANAEFYASPEWRALVARLIRQRGRRCECGCGTVGGLIIGDHRVELTDGGAPLDPDNIMLMSQACHNRKTARARAERMRTR